jgi:hypothetical protein
VAAQLGSLEAMGVPPTGPLRGRLPAQWLASLRVSSLQCLPLPWPLQVRLNQHRETLAAQQASVLLVVSPHQA